jgi:hypothetical protein
MENEMSQYFLSVHHAEGDDEAMAAMTPDDMQRLFTQVDAFNTKLQAEGAWLFAGGLMPIEQSTCVDATGEKPVITDGPFAESKEYLGGFWIIEAPDLDTAIRLAAEGSKACRGKVEVRAFDGLG